jgi:hypothetical protein
VKFKLGHKVPIARQWATKRKANTKFTKLQNVHACSSATELSYYIGSFALFCWDLSIYWRRILSCFNWINMKTDTELQNYLATVFVDNEYPIVWQPDNDVLQCNKCEKDFHVFLRKHHCMLISSFPTYIMSRSLLWKNILPQVIFIIECCFVHLLAALTIALILTALPIASVIAASKKIPNSCRNNLFSKVWNFSLFFSFCAH